MLNKYLTLLPISQKTRYKWKSSYTVLIQLLQLYFMVDHFESFLELKKTQMPYYLHPALNVGTTCAIFNRSGKYPSIMHRLKIWTLGSAKMSSTNLTILLDISKKPPVFELFKSWIKLQIDKGVIALKKRIRVVSRH